MSKGYNNTNKINYYSKRIQKNNDVICKAIDPTVLKSLEETQIKLTQKPSSKCPRGRFICKICNSHMLGIDKALQHNNDAGHKRNFKKSCDRNMMKYLPQPNDIQLEAIENCLRNALSTNIFISNTECERRIALFNEMNCIVCDNGGLLILCGSLVTGLSMNNVSDVNMYLDISSKIHNGVSYFTELKKLSSEFTEKLKLKCEIKLDKEDCGLFCKDSQGVTYHVTDSTRACQLTSDLIAAYMKIDERAENLIKVFRYFANQAFIDRTRDGFLPVQVFALLVVFYLQQLQIPILPNLHKLADVKGGGNGANVTTVTVNGTVVRYVSDLDTVKSLWKPPTNNATLAQLWVGLLRFYAVEFDSAQYVVSVQSCDPVLKVDRKIKHKRLAVDDPFDAQLNLLFSFNLQDAVDFFTDQLEVCYQYFAVPQVLLSGPAFTSVRFTVMTLQTMTSRCLMTPTFSKDNFSVSVELMETEFRDLYRGQSSVYDVSSWPVSLFVASVLAKVLTSVFDSRREIESLLMLIDVRSNAVLTVTSYGVFKEYAMNLAMRLFQDFSQYIEDKNGWNSADISTTDALDIVRKASQKFITECLKITINEENEDDNEDVNDEEFEKSGMENDEMESENNMEDVETILDDDFGDNVKSFVMQNSDQKTVKCTESWKIPISFQLICLKLKGFIESSNDNGVYNEHRVNSFQPHQLGYDFHKIPIHKKKMEVICMLCREKGHRKEYCKEATPRFDELKYVLRDIKEEWLSKLRPILNRKYETVVLPTDRQQVYWKIFDDISKIIRNLYPTSKPQLFGSSNNGFMTRSSDLDICMEIFYDESRNRLTNKEVSKILRSIGHELKNLFPKIGLEYILSAKVPIIKFYFPNSIHGDISVNNILGVENSKMLKLYGDLFTPMKVLGNLIKFMSKSCEIGEASQGTLSSYAYIVMLIHFLQKRGLLPVLQELYEDKIRPTNMIDGWDAWYQPDTEIINKLWNRKPAAASLEYLWLDFFYYYTVEFDIDMQVVSIKQSEPLFKIDKGWQRSYLAIEDPFNRSHNLGRSLSFENFRYILFCFAHVLKVHSNNDNLLRNEKAYHMLMEPSTLRPSNIDFKEYNRRGQSARDSQVQRPNTKMGNSESDELPKLSLPYHFKQSTNSNNLYIKTDNSVTGLNSPISLKNLNGTIDDFSVIPVSLSFGNKSIVIPMLTGSDDKITDKLNNMFENGLRNVCCLPLEVVEKNNKSSQLTQPPCTGPAIDSVDRPRSNYQDTGPGQYYRPEYKEQTRNKYGHGANNYATHNPVRLMATNPNYNTPRQPGYRTQYGPIPRPPADNNYYYDYQRPYNNGRSATPNNRYQNRGNR